MNPPPYLLVESFYSLVIVISCLVIYLRTRAMYKLTEYKGLSYFSKTFMYLSIAYFFRYFFRVFFRIIVHELFRPQRPGFNIGEAVFVYASTMAALYFLYSLIWKDLKAKNIHIIFHMLAAALTLAQYITHDPMIQIAFLGIIYTLGAIISHVRKPKGFRMRTCYKMVFLFWLADIISLGIPRFLVELRVAINTVCLVLILLILWRVLHPK